MAFDEVQFPPEISYGAVGGPQFSTTVTITAGGFEQRNVNWSQARGRYDVAHGLKDQDDLDALINFFRARQGRARGFRFKDWTDYKHDMTSTPVRHQFGAGNGSDTIFQITKTYTSLVGYIRNIRKVVTGTLNVYDNGVLQTYPGDYSVDLDTGLVTFVAPPAMSNPLEWEGEFDVAARFDTDTMEVEIEFFETHNWSGIPVVEVRAD